MNRDSRARRLASMFFRVADLGPLLNLIDRERHDMSDPSGNDFDVAILAADREGYGDDRFQGVALGSTRGGRVGLAGRYADLKVEDSGYRLWWDAGAVVRDRNALGVHPNRDDRRGARLLAGVEGVVDEFLYDHEGPVRHLVTDLRYELAARTEVQRPARLESRPAELALGARGGFCNHRPISPRFCKRSFDGPQNRMAAWRRG